MATITFPSTPKPESMVWRLVQPAQTNISTWTGARQTLGSNRGWWECDITMPPVVSEASARQWLSFIAQTQGQVNDFQIKVSPNEQFSNWATPLTNLSLNFLTGAYSANSTSDAGKAFVKGSGQTGRSLATFGWLPSTTVLYAGQHITIGNQLLRLTADVVANAAGEATISFAPPLRVSPANNTAIEFRNPYALMYVTDQINEPIEPGMIYSFSFTLRESF